MIRYEDGLAVLFKSDTAPLTSMAMAELAGLADRVPGWLEAAQQGKSSSGSHELLSLFDTLHTGDAAQIETALRADVRKLTFQLDLALGDQARSGPAWLDRALEGVAQPLILLGRGDVLAEVHAEAVRGLRGVTYSSATAPAALDVAAAGDFDLALQLLEQARRADATVEIALSEESLLWKHAYLHHRLDVLPILAAMQFRGDTPHTIARRAWDLKIYQLRAGVPGVAVPVLEGEQPYGYAEAAALQIAVLADDPSAADLVRELRRVLKPKTMDMVHFDRRIAVTFTGLPQDFSTAEARIAARRKDYAKAAALARLASKNILIDPPSVVIDAFLEEGNWRAAAEIAKEHDPRRRPLIEGFDDDRARECVRLYNHLAVAAAWSGDDAAADAFLATAKHVNRTEVPADLGGGDNDDAVRWIETLLAGAAEGLLPRKFLHVLTHAFRTSW